MSMLMITRLYVVFLVPPSPSLLIYRINSLGGSFLVDWTFVYLLAMLLFRI